MENTKESTQHEAEQKRLAQMVEAKPTLARVALSSFVSAFELLRPDEHHSAEKSA